MLSGTTIENKSLHALLEVLWIVEVVGLSVPRVRPFTGVRARTVLLVSGTVLILPPKGVDIRDKFRCLHSSS